MRRLARASGLRCLRVVRRHHFSMLSAGVLAGALAVALTSSAFDVDEPAAANQAPAAGNTRPGPALSAPPRLRMPESPRSRLVVYYVIDSEAQRRGIETAVQADVTFQDLQSLAGQPVTYRDFLWARDRDEEIAALDFLNELAVLAQQQDYQFRVVDLR